MLLSGRLFATVLCLSSLAAPAESNEPNVQEELVVCSAGAGADVCESPSQGVASPLPPPSRSSGSGVGKIAWRMFDRSGRFLFAGEWSWILKITGLSEWDAVEASGMLASDPEYDALYQRYLKVVGISIFARLAMAAACLSAMWAIPPVRRGVKRLVSSVDKLTEDVHKYTYPGLVALIGDTQKLLGGWQLRFMRYFSLSGGCLYVHADGRQEYLRGPPPRPCGTVRCVCISDTHTHHWELDVPRGDVLLHAGDVLLESRGADAASLEQLDDFDKWLSTQPHPFKVLIAGNHDGAMAALGPEGVHKRITSAIYLEDTTIECANLRIHGSPLSFGHSDNSAFQPRPDCNGGYNESLALERIPNDLDILITHGPGGSGPMTFGRGSAALAERVVAVRPRFCVCGHLHTRHGAEVTKEGVVVVNASSANFLYAVVRPPIVFDLEPRV